MSPNNTSLTHDDYTVAWVCPLEVEQIAAIQMLDSEHARLPQPANDHNVYTLGSINGHNIVIAGLHSPGNNPAAVVVTQMRNTFKQLRFGLLVGIGGGVPTKTERGSIHLGHVVVSKPVGEHSGVVQYDHGKAEVGQFRHTGFIAPPPTVLLNAAQEMDVRRAMAQEDPLLQHIALINTAAPGLRRYKYPGADKDHLYRVDYVHSDPNVSCWKCGCDSSQIVDRHAEDSDDEDNVYGQDQQLVVHRGTIAAGELVIKNGKLRDELASQYNILCFEMEAAGALADFPCLVIRGVSDYSDSHKNDRWHGYAAAAAAAYARELFFHMPVDEVKQCKIAEQDVKQMIAHVEHLAQDNKHHNIHDWLKPPDTSTNLNEAQKKRHEGTGSWFLESKLFKDWKSGTRQFLWLHGIPGCGKTVLSAIIIDHLKQQLDSTQVVLAFFFDFNSADKQSLDQLVRSLTAQLYSSCENSRKELDKLFLSCEGGCRQPTYESLRDTFMRMVSHAEKIQIIIDALDECKTIKYLLLWLENLASSKHARLHLLMTSRKEEEIESAFKCWLSPEHLIWIKRNDVNRDIRAYVHERLRNDREFKRWHSQPSVRDNIEKTLMEKADGMFRWAACQLDSLADCIDSDELQEALNSLPKSLDETYSRILSRILAYPERRRKKAIQILQFLAYSERPLTAEEAVDAVVVDLDRSPKFDPRRRMPNPRDIATICSSLVSFVTRRPKHRRNGEVTELQLAHLSVKEYLTSGRVEAIFQESFTEISARASITRICLAYLSHLDARRSRNQIRAEFPLADYCAGYWMDHARHAETKKTVQKSILDFFLHRRQTYAVWEKLWYPDRYSLEEPNQIGYMATPLYYASLAGLQFTVALLLEKGADVNAKCGKGNALCVASLYGYTEIVQLLLENGADINGGDNFYGNALHAASYNSHTEVVQLLLENKADVNAHIGFYGNALQAASVQGHTDTVQLLLENKANINAEGGVHGNALYAASKAGHKEIVQLLLENGADINAKGTYGSALCVASLQGHKGIVQLLLENGADVDAEGGVYGTALCVASLYGYTEFVQLLLENGANVNAEDGEYGTALNAASMEGHKEIVQLLLENGADVNAEGGAYGTALKAASMEGQEEIVQLLLESGADVDAGDEDGNALHAASAGGYKEIVQLLLENGANVNAEGGEYGTALKAASMKGHKEILQLLLESGADVDAGDEDGNALHAASAEGYADENTEHGERGKRKREYEMEYNSSLPRKKRATGRIIPATPEPFLG